jgi:hypothetical protein
MNKPDTMVSNTENYNDNYKENNNYNENDNYKENNNYNENDNYYTETIKNNILESINSNSNYGLLLSRK